MKQTLAEAIRFRAPNGFHAAVRAAAEQQELKPSEFIRRAVIEAARRVIRQDDNPSHLSIHNGPRGSLIAA